MQVSIYSTVFIYYCMLHIIVFIIYPGILIGVNVFL